MPSQRTLPSPPHQIKYQRPSHTSPSYHLAHLPLCLCMLLMSRAPDGGLTARSPNSMFRMPITVLGTSSAPFPERWTCLLPSTFFANSGIHRGCSLCLGCVSSGPCHHFPSCSGRVIPFRKSSWTTLSQTGLLLCCFRLRPRAWHHLNVYRLLAWVMCFMVDFSLNCPLRAGSNHHD